MSKERNLRVVAILAGGQGRRMGCVDKGAVKLGDQRLVDHVYQKLVPQADHIVIAGSNGYGLRCEVISDLENSPPGPAAGLYALCDELPKQYPSIRGFFTVPIDAPFLSSDLLEQLSSFTVSSIAATSSGLHPTFAYWQFDELRLALRAVANPSLREIASHVGVRSVLFKDEIAFTNINTPDELTIASTLISTD